MNIKDVAELAFNESVADLLIPCESQKERERLVEIIKKEFRQLQAQLAAAKADGETLRVLEEWLESNWGFYSVQKLHNPRLKRPYQMTLDSENYQYFATLREAINAAGVEGGE